jgi:hypothetical protein
MKGYRSVVVGVACFAAAAVATSAFAAEAAQAGEKAAKAKKAAKGAKPEKGWISLVNGKDLTGWKPVGGADWKVVDGMLVGKQGPNNAPGDLLTEKSFDNFELTVTYKCTWPCNSGVWFRYQNEKTAYQADILDYKKPVAFTGSLYSPGYPPGQTFMVINLDKDIEKRDDWNTFQITANGDHIVIVLNGKKTVDVRDKHVAEGKIGYQVHPGAEFGPMSITVKEIRIRPVKPAKAEAKEAAK